MKRAEACGIIDAEALQQQLEEIRGMLRRFNEVWPDHVIHAEAYPLPMLTAASGETGLEVVKLPTIVPEHIEGEDAVSMLRSAIAQLHFLPGQHPGTVVRWPGVVFVDRDFGQEIGRINAAKDALEAAFTAAVPPPSRAKIRARIFPGLSMLQTYRHIHYWDRPLGRISFGWAGRTTSSVRITRPEAEARLRQLLHQCPEGVDPEEWQMWILRDIEDLGKKVSANQVLRIRKPIAPHPRVALFEPGKTRPATTFHANLPLFIYLEGGSSDTLPDVTPLLSYLRAEHMQPSRRRSDAQTQHLIVARLNLFAVDR